MLPKNTHTSPRRQYGRLIDLLFPTPENTGIKARLRVRTAILSGWLMAAILAFGYIPVFAFVLSDTAHVGVGLLVVCLAVACLTCFGVTSAFLAFRSLYTKTAKRLETENGALSSASQAKTKFLATLSHEIRWPLNGIVNSLNGFDRSAFNDDQWRRISLARESAQSILDMVNETLDIACIESGRLKITNRTFELDRLLLLVTETLSENAHAKNINLVVERGPWETDWLVSDPARIRQILLNLVGNAIKFTDTGSITLRATVKSRDVMRDVDDQRALDLTISVEDTGIGISEDQMGGLFNGFFKADNNPLKESDGAGLGLAICKELLDLMGGEIHAVSAPGKGSCFSIHLPVKEGKPQKLAPPPNLADQSNADRNRPLNILIAEDHHTNQAILKLLLKETGHRLTIVENGVEAVEAIKREDFDVILMDDMMPRLSGRDATRTIRTLGNDKSVVPIIALTANAALDRGEYKEAGMDWVLEKPLRPEELFNVLKNVAAKRANP